MKHLDYRFPTRDGASVRIVERPALWMGASELTTIVEDVRAVVRSSIPTGVLDYGVGAGGVEHLKSTILTIVYGHDGRPVAFNALVALDCELRGKPIEVLHLGLGIVDPSYRGRGLSSILYGLTCFLLSARRRMRSIWISNVTQVPAAFGLVTSAFANVFPAPDGRSRRSFDHLCLGRQIMLRHRGAFGVGPEAVFDETRFVIEDSYTGGSDNLKKTFAETAKHRDPAFNDMCERELDYDRGDDFLQIGQWTLAVGGAYFNRLRSVMSPAALTVRVAFLLLESLVVPALQWLDPTHPMGELRPWGAST